MTTIEQEIYNQIKYHVTIDYNKTEVTIENNPFDFTTLQFDYKLLENHLITITEGKITYKNFYFLNTVKDTIIKSHIVLERYNSLPQFETYLYSLLNIILYKPLPNVTLDDFVVGFDNLRWHPFGIVQLWITPKDEMIDYFRKDSQKRKDITIENIVALLEEIQLIVGMHSSFYDHFEKFIYRVKKMNKKEEIENDEFYKRCKFRCDISTKQITDLGEPIPNSQKQTIQF